MKTLIALATLLALIACGQPPSIRSPQPAPTTGGIWPIPFLPVGLDKTICGQTFTEGDNGVVYQILGRDWAGVDNGSYSESSPVCIYTVLDGRICEGLNCTP